MSKDLSDVKCFVVEVSVDYFSILIDDYSYHKIPITKEDTEVSIKNKIYEVVEQYLHTTNGDSFDEIDDVPIKVNTYIDLSTLYDELGKTIPIEDEEFPLDEIRSFYYPTFDQFINSIYEKEVNNNLDYYNQIIKQIATYKEIFPNGDTLTGKQIEDILNGN